MRSIPCALIVICLSGCGSDSSSGAAGPIDGGSGGAQSDAAVDASPDAFGGHTGPGRVDTGWGSGGLVTFPKGFAGAALRRDSTGRILVAGADTNAFVVHRLLANGTFDSSYGSGGNTRVEPAADTRVGVHAMLLTSDEGALIAGSINDAAGTDGQDVGLLRLLPNGGADTGFGTNGIVRSDLTTKPDWAHGVDVDATGRIIATGAAFGGNNELAVVRYTAQGELDTTFGTGGVSQHDLSPAYDVGHFGFVLSDGTITTIGESGGTVNKPFRAQLASDGTLKTDVLQNGWSSFSFDSGAYKERPYDAYRRADDSVVVAVRRANSPNIRSGIAVFTPGATFPDQVKLEGMEAFAALQTTPLGLAEQADGRMLIVGAFSKGNELFVARLLKTGEIDKAFGENGVISYGISVNYEALGSLSPYVRVVTEADAYAYVLVASMKFPTVGTALFRIEL